MTQKALAKVAGIGERTISDLERGVNQTPWPYTLGQILEHLPMSPADRERLEAAARNGTPHTRRRKRQALDQANALAFSAQSSTVSKLVGREAEMGLIEHHLEQSATPLLLFGGEPGLGKSRLLHEAIAHAQQDGWCVLQGGCQRRSGQEAYTPIVSALAAFIKMELERQLEHLRRAMQDCPDLWYILPELIPLGLQTPPTWQMPPDQVRRLLFQSVIRFVQQISGEGKVVLVLDDLQWAGKDALDLLTALACAPGNQALCIIGAYRTNENPPGAPLAHMIADLTRDAHAIHHFLKPLDTPAATTLLKELGSAYAADTVSDASASVNGSGLADAIVARSDGVPFFLVSYAQGRQHDNSGPLPQEIPHSLAANIRQRLVALPSDARAILDVVATAGREIAQNVLLAVLQARRWPKTRLHRAIEVALQAELLATTEDDKCQITHDLIRDVVLHDMAASRRADLHGQLALALEAMPSTSAEILAYHFLHADLANVAEKAIKYLWLAAQHAQSVGAFVKSAEYYQQLVHILEAQRHHAERVMAYEQLGMMQTLLSQYDRALDTLGAAETLCRTTQDIAGLIRIITAIGRVHRISGNMKAGVTTLTTFFGQHTSNILASPEVAKSYEVLADLYYQQSNFSAVLATAETGLNIVDSTQDALLAARLSIMRGTALGQLGRQHESVALIDAAIPHVLASQDLWSKCQLLSTVSQLYILWGYFDSLPLLLKAWSAVAHTINNPELLTESIYHQGMYHYLSGNWRAAHETMIHGRQFVHQHEGTWASTFISISGGFMEMVMGNRSSGLQLIHQGLQRALEEKNSFSVMSAHYFLAEDELVHSHAELACSQLKRFLDGADRRSLYTLLIQPLLAWAYLCLGAEEEADTLLTSTMSHLKLNTIPIVLFDCIRIKALLHQHRKNYQAALATCQEGLEVLKAYHYPYYKARLLYVYGLICHEIGDNLMAMTQLHASLAILHQLGEHLYEPLVVEALRQAEAAQKNSFTNATVKATHRPFGVDH